MRHLWSLLLALFVVNFGILFFVPDSPTIPSESRIIRCARHYAIEIPRVDPYFAGAYVRCEDFDHYFDLVQAADREGAEKLLLTKPPRGYDKEARN